MLSRRDFGKASLTGLWAVVLTRRAAALQSAAFATVRGVKLGAITGVFGPFVAADGGDVVDAVITSAKSAGISHVEFVTNMVEPRVTGGGVGGQAPAAVTPAYSETREALRRWRLSTPL